MNRSYLFYIKLVFKCQQLEV